VAVGRNPAKQQIIYQWLQAQFHQFTELATAAALPQPPIRYNIACRAD